MTFVGAALGVLLLGGWMAWFYPFDDLLDHSGTPLGADFAMFYVSGQLVADGAGHLYGQAEHQRRLHALFPGLDAEFALPYRYPPLVAAGMAPLARLPYAAAYFVFLGLSGMAWLVALRCLWAELPSLREHWRSPVCWALLGWPVAWETLLGGQASMFGLLILAAAYRLLRNQRYAVAGVVLALALYKPNLLLFVVMGCVLRHPRILLGLVPASFGMLLLCLWPAGSEGLIEYRQLSTSLASQTWDVATPYWKVHGLAPWFSALPLGRLVCLAAGVALTLLLTVASPRDDKDRRATTPLWFAGLVSINFLFNPYAPLYDLVLLVVPALLVAEYATARCGPHVDRQLCNIQIALAVLYFGPHLSQGVAKITGVQLFALAVLAVLAGQLASFCRLPRSLQHPSGEVT